KVDLVDGAIQLWTIKWQLIALALLGALIGAALAWLLPPRWEAIALIRIGEIGRIQAESQTPELVESAARAAERVRDPAFRRRVIEQLADDPTHAAGDLQLIRGSLLVNALRNADLIEVRVSGTTPEASRHSALAIVEELARAHASILQPSLQRMQAQLRNAQAELNLAVEQRARLLEVSTLRDELGAGERFSENVLLGSLISARDAEIRTLQERVLRLQEAMSPERTFPSRLLSDVFVPERPSFPRRLLFVLGGAALFAFAGLAWRALAAGRGTRSRAVPA
ncbi:MAG TPA: Wzz/FepE/Etk N-terminal domain-containing protein, partial [Burkholderiaceae bacterium]|nr:Wzz/FepE/Etk N-terminal domain-containing protein [Burkholderiaceae bacterium]